MLLPLFCGMSCFYAVAILVAIWAHANFWREEGMLDALFRRMDEMKVAGV